MSEPIRVVVTGAAGHIGYSLVYLISKGGVFGPKQTLILHLLELPHRLEILKAVVMELADCALPLLHHVVPTADPVQAFTNISYAFLACGVAHHEEMERKHLLTTSVQMFKVQGQLIDLYARKDVKVLVLGSPANTNCLVCSKYAPSIPKKNFTALTRLDLNRALSQIAARAEVSVADVYNVVIWGNHSSTQVPDAFNAKITTGKSIVSVTSVVDDDAWLKKEFVRIVQRGQSGVCQMSSAICTAKAACDHMRDWVSGTEPGKFVSMGVLSDGSYGAPKDVVFSFPVTIKNGQWEIVQGLEIEANTRRLMDLSGEELEEEKHDAFIIVEAS